MPERQITFEEVAVRRMAIGAVIEVWDGWSQPDPKWHPGEKYWHRAEVVRDPVEVVSTSGLHSGHLVHTFDFRALDDDWTLPVRRYGRLVEDEGAWWRWPNEESA